MLTTNLAHRVFDAVYALIVYKLREQHDREGSMPECLVTQHTIQNGELSEGHPISRKKLQGLCELLMPYLKQKGIFFPERLLSYSPYSDTMIWWHPPAVRNIFFSRNTKLKSGSAPVPGMLFMVQERRLHAWALKGKERPGPETMLFSSPFFNNHAGTICTGSATLPKHVSPDHMNDWEDVFFNSGFTLEGHPS